MITIKKTIRTRTAESDANSSSRPAPATPRRTASILTKIDVKTWGQSKPTTAEMLPETADTKEEAPSGRIRVLIASETKTDARIFSAQLSSDEFMVVGTATSLSELEVTLHLRNDIDVLVTDVVLGGMQLAPTIEQAVASHPNLNVLCYTLHEDADFVVSAIQAGALGYVLRDTQESLANCVRLISRGGSPMSPQVTRHVLRAMQASNHPDPSSKIPADRPELSAREHEILNLLAKGLSFSDIASLLYISPHTVTAHIKKLYRKLQVHSRAEAVYEARAMQLIDDN